jgi:hypothetical protein
MALNPTAPAKSAVDNERFGNSVPPPGGHAKRPSEPGFGPRVTPDPPITNLRRFLYICVGLYIYINLEIVFELRGSRGHALCIKPQARHINRAMCCKT